MVFEIKLRSSLMVYTYKGIIILRSGEIENQTIGHDMKQL